MKLSFLILLTLVLAKPLRSGDGETQAVRPNVLFIAIDDLNDWTGYLGGHPQAQTPNLDRLAASGVAFMQAYCAAPVCIPSRAAVLTGIPPHISGITNNIGLFRQKQPDLVTLPQRMRAGGYRVMKAGKLFHHPDPVSWDEQLPNSRSSYKLPKPPKLGQDIRGLEWGALDVAESQLIDHKISDWVCAQLGKSWDQPFFLACGLIKPHLPWSVPQRFFDMFPLEEIQLPLAPVDDLNDMPKVGAQRARSVFHGQIIKQNKWKAAIQAYLATVAYCDERVGAILNALAEGPNAKNTLVILWSDHGMALGEKKHWQKWGLWEDTTRVPLIFAGPGIPVGVQNPHAVGILDLYRTTLELCGMQASEQLGGHSLVPLIQDPKLSRPAPVLTTLNKEHSVRSDRWRLIRYIDGSYELYDHSVDPHEWTNLAELPEHGKLIRELAGWMPEQKRAPKRSPGPKKKR